MQVSAGARTVTRTKFVTNQLDTWTETKSYTP